MGNLELRFRQTLQEQSDQEEQRAIHEYLRRRRARKWYLLRLQEKADNPIRRLWLGYLMLPGRIQLAGWVIIAMQVVTSLSFCDDTVFGVLLLTWMAAFAIFLIASQQ